MAGLGRPSVTSNPHALDHQTRAGRIVWSRAAPTCSHWAETQRRLELYLTATLGGEPEVELALG
jgi:hypothetical protein